MTRYSGKNWGISYHEKQRKHDIGQPTGWAMLPSGSVESAGEEKHVAEFQHFILEWAKHLLGWKPRKGGSLGTYTQRELQYLPQRIVIGATWTQEGRDKLRQKAAWVLGSQTRAWILPHHLLSGWLWKAEFKRDILRKIPNPWLFNQMSKWQHFIPFYGWVILHCYIYTTSFLPIHLLMDT